MLPEGSVNLPPQSKPTNQQQQQQQQQKSEVNEGCELRDYGQSQNKEKARLFHSFVFFFKSFFFLLFGLQLTGLLVFVLVYWIQ